MGAYLEFLTPVCDVTTPAPLFSAGKENQRPLSLEGLFSQEGLRSILRAHANYTREKINSKLKFNTF